MSGRIILVLLAVNLVLIRSAPIENGNPNSTESKERDVDSLINQLQQEKGGVEGSSVNGNNDAVIRELLKNQTFIDQLVDFLQHFQNLYQFFMNGGSGSVAQTVQSSQSQTTTTTNNVNKSNVRGLFNNPTFLSFLSGFLQHGQGFSFVSNNAASQSQQNSGSQSHVSSHTTTSQQTTYTQNGVNNVPQVPSVGVNNAPSINQDFVVVTSQTKPVVVGSSAVVNNVVSSNHVESVVSNHVVNNAASTNQNGYVVITSQTKPVVGFNAVVNNAVSSNHAESVASNTVVNNDASTNQNGYVVITSQSKPVVVGSNSVVNNAVSSNHAESVASNTVVNNDASTNQNGYVVITSQTKPVVVGSNSVVNNAVSSHHAESVASNTVVNNDASTNQNGYVVITSQTKPVVVGSNSIVNNAVSSNHAESVASNTVVNKDTSTNQNGYVVTNSQSKPVVAGSNAGVNNALSSNNVVSNNGVNNAATNEYIVITSQTKPVIVGSNTVVNNAASSNHVESVISNTVVNNAASTNHNDYAVIYGETKPVVVGSNYVVNNAASTNNVHQESNTVVSNAASTVINGHSRPVIFDVPSQNIATDTASLSAESESSTSFNEAQAPTVVASNPASLEYGQAQTVDQEPILDARFNNPTSGATQIIITKVNDNVSNNAASSQTSNSHQVVANTGSSNNQAILSDEALIDQFISGGASQSTASYHSEQSSQSGQVNVNGVPQVQIPSVHNTQAFDTAQQQIVANQQYQNSASVSNQAAHSSDTILEDLRRNQLNTKPVVSVSQPQPSGSFAQNNGDASFHSESSSHSSLVNGAPQISIIHAGPSVPIQVGSGLQNIAASNAGQLNDYSKNEAEAKLQAQNANYKFATSVNDNINGNFQQRAEIREGSKVTGKYSYDDGFVWRTVYYQADENGYRIIKEETSPSHMTSNANGDADIKSWTDGNLVNNYHITRKDIGTRKITHQQQYGSARSQN